MSRTRTRYYSTADVCAALGVTRATLYNWRAEPDMQGPGERGTLSWSERTIRKLAEQHDRTVDESVLSDAS